MRISNLPGGMRSSHTFLVPKIRTAGGTSEVGRRLRAVRATLGWSQEKLAELAGFDRIKVVNLESGRNQASSAAVRDGLRLAFGVNSEAVSNFLDGEFVDASAAATWLLEQRVAYSIPQESVAIWRLAARENGDNPDDPSVARTYASVFSSMLKAAAATAHEQVKIHAGPKESEEQK